MSLPISVVICTHNPRREFLSQALEHLGAQTLSVDQWELLIVDNGSQPPTSQWVDLSWHPRGRIIREEAIGLTNARLCGIANSVGDTIVFVDDDNLLATNYLAEGLRIAEAYPFLGAWGGQQEPVFECEPPPWVRMFHFDQLALRQVPSIRWTNMPYHVQATPHGAGMCIRRRIAMRYAQVVTRDPLRRSLDRSGASLSGCGDHDMAFVACDEGLGVGLFPELVLRHLMPPNRLAEEYLLRIVEGTNFSASILHYCRDGKMPSQPSMNLLRRAWLWLRLRKFNPYERRKIYAGIRGAVRAKQHLEKLRKDGVIDSR